MKNSFKWLTFLAALILVGSFFYIQTHTSVPSQKDNFSAIRLTDSGTSINKEADNLSSNNANVATTFS
jgi:hypothetical protein